MAHEANLEMVSVVAAADLSTKNGYAVKLDSNGKAVLSDATSLTFGILQTNPGNGQVGSVAVNGVCKAVAGGNITAGARVMSNASGQLIAATTAGNAVIGVAMEGAASGDVFPVLIRPMPFAALA